MLKNGSTQNPLAFAVYFIGGLIIGALLSGAPFPRLGHHHA
jgi:hypothetical protein